MTLVILKNVSFSAPVAPFGLMRDITFLYGLIKKYLVGPLRSLFPVVSSLGNTSKNSHVIIKTPPPRRRWHMTSSPRQNNLGTPCRCRDDLSTMSCCQDNLSILHCSLDKLGTAPRGPDDLATASCLHDNIVALPSSSGRPRHSVLHSYLIPTFI